MAEVTNWHGSVWGASTKGTAFAELTHTGNHITGRFTVFEPGIGNFNARLDGEWTDNAHIHAALGEFQGQYSFPVIMPQAGRMDGTFDPAEGVITGTWATNTPSNGKFILMKMDAAQPARPDQPPQQIQAPPPQNSGNAPPPPLPAPRPPLHSLTTKTLVLRSYRLGEDDVRRLAEVIKSGTNVLTPGINASHKGSEYIHVGLDAVLNDPMVPAIVYNMIIAANEPSINVGIRTVILNLKQHDPSTLFVSGDDRVWVEGKVAQILEFLERHQSKSTHILRNYGQTLNSLFFLAMLALLPSIRYLRQRMIVVAATFALLLMLMYSWRQANTKIFLREEKSTWYQRHSDTLLVLLEVGLTAIIGLLIHRFIGGAE